MKEAEGEEKGKVRGGGGRGSLVGTAECNICVAQDCAEGRL